MCLNKCADDMVEKHWVHRCFISNDTKGPRPVGRSPRERAKALNNWSSSGSRAVYDISDQVFPAHGQHRVLSDLERVSRRLMADPRWYGGEFVMGPAAEFSTISLHLESCWDVADEVIMSCALNMARADGVWIVDCGQLD